MNGMFERIFEEDPAEVVCFCIGRTVAAIEASMMTLGGNECNEVTTLIGQDNIFAWGERYSETDIDVENPVTAYSDAIVDYIRWRRSI